VAVAKLLPVKFTKIKLRQDALQTTILNFLDIFYPGNSDRLGGIWTFSTPTLHFTHQGFWGYGRLSTIACPLTSIPRTDFLTLADLPV
jgi:hypothetical protein